MTASQIYEVFLKADGKSEFRHVGALGAADNEMALLLARSATAAEQRVNRFG